MYDQNTFPDLLFIDQNSDSSDSDSFEQSSLNKNSGDDHNCNSYLISDSNSQLIDSNNDFSNFSNFESQLSFLTDINIDDTFPDLIDTIDYQQFEIQSINDNQLSNNYINSNSSLFIQNNISSNDSNISFKNNQNSKLIDIEKKSRKKINLSSNSQLFKNAFYRVFTNKKRFSKYLVKEIHDFLHDSLNLPKMRRDQIRSIDLYFDEFSKFSNLILSFLQVNKDKIIIKIPELAHLN